MSDRRLAAAWEDEGRRVATELGDARAVVVTGDDLAAMAAVACGIVAAHAPWRRVAVGDLTGRMAALEERAIAIPAVGLGDAFTDGRPLSDIAVPLRDVGGAFLLPSGADVTAARRDTARWGKLAAGFRAMDALLVLVAPLAAKELGALCAALDGAVVVGVNPARVRHLRVVATADGPDLLAEAPSAPPFEPAAPAPPSPPSPEGRRPVAPGRRARRTAALALLTVGGVAVGTAALRRPSGRDAARRPTPAQGVAAAEAPAVPAVGAADTVAVPAVVNPADSASAAAWAVELVATSTATDANLVVQQAGRALPAPTVALTEVGRGGARFYRVVAGAAGDRDAAAALLERLRASGVAPRGTGAVTRVPYAFELETGVSREVAPAVVGAFVGRGVPAYALLQTDGTVTVYAGAFSTPDQSALQLLALRGRGLAPRLAFRLGRPL